MEGVPTDVDRDYAEVRAGVLRYARWRERPDDAATIAEAEKTLAASDNFKVASLAKAFLCASGRTGPTSSRVPNLVCPPKGVTCDSW